MGDNSIQGSGVKRSPVARSSSVVPAQNANLDCCIEDLGKLGPFVDLFWRRDFAVLVVERCGNFGFEHFLLLLRHSVSGSPTFLS